MNIKDSIEYKAIQEFYGDGEAKRSHIPFMNHIDEGLAILERINASDRAKRAFCIHPIAQSYNDVSFSDVEQLAKEYTYFANKFLCTPETDHIRSVEALGQHLFRDIDYLMSSDCRDMLIADKEQNQKDFMIHHYGTHPRYAELGDYFNIWLVFLKNYRKF